MTLLAGARIHRLLGNSASLGPGLPYLGPSFYPYAPECAEKNRNSRKFKVASDPSSSAPCTRVRQGGASSESERRDLVAFVAPLCSKALRLATSQLPENSCPIGPGPGQSRTSA
jgi:hypothetical protein